MTDNSLVVMGEFNVTDGCEEICCVRPREDRAYGPQDDRDKANATLIAASPDMAQAIADWLKADAAIVHASDMLPGERRRNLDAAKAKARAALKLAGL